MQGQIPILGHNKILQIGLTLSLFLIAASIAKGQDPIPALVKQVEPAIVTIITYDKNRGSLKLGSGFFISPRHVISNRHVLEDAHRGEIKTADGKVYPIQGVVAEDKDGDLIQLLVNIPDSAAKPLKVSTTLPQRGEKIIVIGSPLGLEQSISDGIVSSVREIPNFGHIIQITAPISSGSSGSPVVNLNGEVIGVATLQIVEGQNLNFALPGERITALTAGTPQTLSEWTLGIAKERLVDADSLYRIGMTFYWNEDYKKALSYFEKTVKIDSQNAKAYFQIGNCNDNLDHYEETITAYKRAVRIKSDYAKAYYNLGIIYYNRSRYKEAVETFKNTIIVKPDYAEAYNNLGAAYIHLGRYEEAIEACKQSIHVNPDNAEAHNNLSAAYRRLGRYQKAIESSKQAIHIRAEYANAHLNLGAAYQKLSRYLEAVEAFKQAIRFSPDLAEAHYGLGLTYLMLKNKGPALEEYKILQNLDKELAKKLYDSIYK